jgi:hypothetical protein
MVWGKSLVGASDDALSQAHASYLDSSESNAGQTSESDQDTATSSGDVTFPDYLEPNSAKAPRFLGGGDQYYKGLSIDTTVDEDWFQWVSSFNGLLTVQILFTHFEGGDLDLQLYNASGSTLLASSTSTDNNEQVTIGVAAMQSYLIRVWGFNGSINFNYDLSIDGPNASLTPDQFEDNDALANATRIGTGDAFYSGLGINAPGDDDWYRWFAHTGGSLRTSVFYVHGPGTDIDLQVFDSAGVLLLGSSTSTDDNEQVIISVTAGQSYLVRVYGFQTSVGAYSLEFDGPNIASDGFEANNSAAAATDLGSGDQSRFGLTLHTGIDQDWYRWLAPANGTLTVDALFSHAVNNNLDLQVYNAGGTSVLGTSSSSDDNEQVSISVAAGQSYLVRMYSSGSVHHDYDLVLNGPDAATIFPDSFENNDTAGAATNLGTGDLSFNGLTIDQVGDDDWYRWLAPHNGPLTVDVIFEQEIGKDVDLYLYDGSGSKSLDSSTAFFENEQVTFNVLGGQNYLIRVFGAVLHPHYDLLINGPEAPLLPDLFENNDTAATAKDLGSGDKSYDGLTIETAGDDDWYRWLSPASGLLTVDAFFAHSANNNLDMQLYNAAGTTLLDSSASTANNEQVTFSVAAGQSYLIRIYGVSGSLHPDYDLRIDGPALNLPDSFENNDTAITATNLGSGDKNYDGLTIDAVGDDDWYRWLAPSTGTMQVDIVFAQEPGRDVDLYLYDSLGTTVLGSSTSFFDNEQVTINVAGGQSYLVRVFGGSAHPEYSLAIDGPDATYAADFNMDGRVDGNDFLILQVGVGILSGAKISDGDADRDGGIDFDDFQIWQTEYDLASATAAASGATASAGSHLSNSLQLVGAAGAAADEQKRMGARHRGTAENGTNDDLARTLPADTANREPQPRSLQVDPSQMANSLRRRPERDSARFAAAHRPRFSVASIESEQPLAAPSRLAGDEAEPGSPMAIDGFFARLAEDRSLLAAYLS